MTMSFLISFPLSALVHISCPKADKGYDMKNAM